MKFLPMPVAVAQRAKMNSAWYDYVVAGENQNLEGQQKALWELLLAVAETVEKHEFVWRVNMGERSACAV